jgi:hypothetical protein
MVSGQGLLATVVSLPYISYSGTTVEITSLLKCDTFCDVQQKKSFFLSLQMIHTLSGLRQ